VHSGFVSRCAARYKKPSGALRLRRAIDLGLRSGERRLLAGGPLAFGEHGAGLFAGGGVDQVVAEEDLRGCCAGGAVLGDVVGADVDCGGGRGGDHLDGHGLAVSAGDAVGLAFGGLNDELEVGHVGRDTGYSECEGFTLAGNGSNAGVFDTDEYQGHGNLSEKQISMSIFIITASVQSVFCTIWVYL